MYKNGIHRYFVCACTAICAIAITPIGAGLCASPQATSNDLSFDVASVKPVLMDASHPFNPNHSGVHVHPAGASYWFMTVGNLVVYAYGIDNIQFRGPTWTTVDPFDIEARFPEGAKKNDDRRMLQTLLKERFDLTFHIERRELESYVLVVGKHGEKLKASLPDPLDAKSEAPLTPGNSNAGEEQAKPEVTQNPDGSIIRKIGNKRIQTVKFDPATFSQHFDVSEMTMEELAKGLRICLGLGFHKVVDETGIKGTYQVAYDCPQPRPPLRVSSSDAGTLPPDPQDDLLTRSLDALGLKLEKRKLLMDVYVIDHADRPSKN